MAVAEGRLAAERYRPKQIPLAGEMLETPPIAMSSAVRDTRPAVEPEVRVPREMGTACRGSFTI